MTQWNERYNYYRCAYCGFRDERRNVRLHYGMKHDPPPIIIPEDVFNDYNFPIDQQLHEYETSPP